MKYILTFNIPNSIPLCVTVDEEKMPTIMQAVNEKKFIKIGDGYYKTTYLATALPDKSQTRIDTATKKALSETKKLYAHHD